MAGMPPLPSITTPDWSESIFTKKKELGAWKTSD
jgi:hypothetical protein